MASLMDDGPFIIQGQGQSGLNKPKHEEQDAVAVVGYSYRFPEGAVSDEQFWELLMDKRCAMTEFPSDRLNVSRWCHPDKKRKMAPRGGCFLKGDVSLFDAPFFSITADEAAALDPQQRHVLEVTYAALENAGIPMEEAAGSQTSVYVGCFGSDWRLMRTKEIETTADYDTLGIGMYMLANRVSWFFDFHGPSMNIDTACSSSLVALDLACQGLLNRETGMGIVSGTNLLLSPDILQIESNVNMLSPDSISYSFDHRANGYCRGEGTGTLVLKRVSDAIRDGDTIRAVIRATGSNTDGLTPSGIMQPSGTAQAQLIQRTYQKAGLSLEPTRYFEAHGTGTPVGDPIECEAIGEVFRNVRSSSDPLVVGALKSNIGHLEGASGIAGIVKSIMILENGIIPPNTNFEKPNPRIDLESLNIRLPLEAIPWPTTGLRRASVNSFGVGGSNAHAVLDDALNYLLELGLEGKHRTVKIPPTEISIAQKSLVLGQPSQSLSIPRLLTLSASTKAGLNKTIQAYKAHFEGSKITDDTTDLEKYIDNLAYTLNTRRSRLSHKSFGIISSNGDLYQLDQKMSTAHNSQQPLVLGFVFTGQGAQWAEMGRELFMYPGFRASIARCQEALDCVGCSWSLQNEILQPRRSSRVDAPEIAQPANTALQIALVDLLDELNIQPAAVIGHSSGEIAAAYAMKAISLSESMKVAYFRGLCAEKLAQTSRKCSPGTMLAVGLSAERAQAHIDAIVNGDASESQMLCIACVNSPKSVTVSGKEDQVDVLKILLEKDEVFVRKLRVPVAYHSPQMKQISQSYRDCLDDLDDLDAKKLAPSCSRLKTTMISTVTGQAISIAQLANRDYWVANLESPVQFTKGLFGVCTEPSLRIRKKIDCSHRSQLGVNALVEIGPHSALQGPIRDTLDTLAWGADINYFSTLKRNEHAVHSLLDTIGRLYCLGVPVNLANLNRLSSPVQTSKHQTLLVDLPSYPFDHSTPYWREGRLSKQIRLGGGHLDLLGKPAADWNPLEAKWTHYIRPTELPWVEDHAITGRIIYPAAGMLVMAIEAAHQMADVAGGRSVLGFELQDVTFQRALTIPRESAGAETSFLLRTLTENGITQPWMEFRLCSYENEEWHQNCHGRIRLDYDGPVDSVQSYWLEAHREVTDDCTNDLSSESLYMGLRQRGYEFGPAFQTISQSRANNRQQAAADVRVFQGPPGHIIQSHVVHPTTLDGILQIGIASLVNGDGQSEMKTSLPTGIKRLWIAKEGLSGPSIGQIQASASMTKLHARGHEFDISAVNASQDRILSQLQGLRTTLVADSAPTSYEASVPNLPMYYIHRVPDLELMDAEQIVSYCASSLPQDDQDSLDFFQSVDFLICKFLHDALSSLPVGSTKNQSILAHIQRYTEWARIQQEKFESGELALSQTGWRDLLDDEVYCESLAEKVAMADDLGSLFVHTGRNLLSILRGDQDPLQLLFQGDQMAKFYAEMNNRPACFNPWARYLQTAAQKNPQMRILEVGAGTGGTTAEVLKAVSTGLNLKEKDALYLGYDYTDISATFFEKASERFADFPRMAFHTLDISQDPVSQGFEAGSYDLIFAANSLHATDSLKTTMQNVRQLLKPRGKLVLYEVTTNQFRAGFIFGLIEGWWNGVNDGRPWTPTLASSEWDTLLQQTGFEGVQVEFPDHVQPECHTCSIIVATAVEPRVSTSSFCFISDPTSTIQERMRLESTKALQLRHGEAEMIHHSLETSTSISDLERYTLIFLVEAERPLLSDISESAFYQIQHLVSQCKSILWVTPGGGAGPKSAEYGLVDGWARTLRIEKTSRRVCTLALDLANGIQNHHSDYIASVINHSLLAKFQPTYEPDFVEIEGQLNVSRIVPASEMTEELNRASQPYEFASRPINELTSVELVARSPGILSSLLWAESQDSLIPLSANEVVIENKAASIGFHDVLNALGKIANTPFGLESSGVILQAGESSGFSVGDRVLTFGAGKLRTRVRTEASAVCLIPDDLSFAQAASTPVAFGAVWHALVEVGNLRRGQSLLVHGAGAIAQAAIQLATYLGAHIYATTSSLDETAVLAGKCGIAEDHIFDSRDGYFAHPVRKMTHSRGVDIVLSFNEKEFAPCDCVAPYGKFIHFGSPGAPAPMPTAAWNQQVSFTYLDIVSWINERPDLVHHSVQCILPLVQSKDLCTEPLCHVEDASNVENVCRAIQDEGYLGQSVTVIDLTMEANVPTVFANQVSFKLSSDATYVIAGGLGGIGRVTAQWFARHGARNLVLLGRSGANSKEAIALVEQLEEEGARVYAPPCDVMDADSVQRVMEEVSSTMPPIRGCIQGCMVLRDQLYENMSHADWRIAAECKALGSKNLSDNLPSDLDFFIFLSSLSGVHGIQGQSNYAAGNTYMDALARQHVAHGRKAIAFDLGVMIDDGLLSESSDVFDRVMKTSGFAPVTRSHFLGLLSLYCDPSRKVNTPDLAQVVLGLPDYSNGIHGNDNTLDQPIFSRLRLKGANLDEASQRKQTTSPRTLFLQAASLQEGRDVVRNAFFDKMVHSYRLVPEDTNIDEDATLSSYRIDSLLAVDICNWIAKEFMADLSVLEVMGGANFTMVHTLVATRSKIPHPGWE
ncbi:hypothetical protein N7488_010774 [Penicillium malachiteum]|nr:hypothetical protein N7488_010774 [Penicillium malachiteum]